MSVQKSLEIYWRQHVIIEGTSYTFKNPETKLQINKDLGKHILRKREGDP